jgi:hypothetical protein
MFGIVTASSLLSLLFLLTLHRFRTLRSGGGKDSASQTEYFPWLAGLISGWLKIPGSARFREWYDELVIRSYPAGQRWIFIILGTSFGYLVLSGFFFALTGIRLQGGFLLLHVILGGLFAVCLGLAVFLRARYYTWDLEDFQGEKGAMNLRTLAARRKAWQIALFWVFAASGLALIVTALGQMLPTFSLRAQLVMFAVHRYAALAALLAALAFVYFYRIDERR